MFSIREHLENTLDAWHYLIRRFEGCRFALIAAGVACELAMAVTLIAKQGRLRGGRVVDETFWYFVLQYWRDNKLLLVAVVCATGAVFWSQPLRLVLGRRFRRSIVLARDRVVDRRLSYCSCALAIVGALCGLLLFPLNHLADTNYINFALSASGCVITVVSLYFIVNPPRQIDSIPALAELSFERPVSLDSGTLGTVPHQAARELARFSRLRRNSSLTDRIGRYLQSGEPGSAWPGMTGLFELLAQFMRVDREDIVLVENTTGAIRHALDHLLPRQDDAILSTDIEYGSIRMLCTATQRKYGCELHVAQLSPSPESGVKAGSFSSEAVVSALVAQARIALEARPHRIIVVVHHVCHISGAVIDLKKLRAELDKTVNDSAMESPPSLYVIVDGAQAVGNVDVSGESGGEIREVEFYATSGHKWLLSRPALGILVVNRTRLGRVHNLSDDEINDYLAAERPFARAVPSHDIFLPTVNVDAHICLGVSLRDLTRVTAPIIAQHNRRLAELFAGRISVWGPEYAVIRRPAECGIIAISTPDAAACKSALEAQQIYCQAVTARIVRLCFHYMLSDDDVYEIADAFSEIVERLKEVQTKSRTLPYSSSASSAILKAAARSDVRNDAPHTSRDQ